MGCNVSKPLLNHTYVRDDNEDVVEQSLVAQWRDHPDQDSVRDLSTDRYERVFWRELLAWKPNRDPQGIDNIKANDQAVVQHTKVDQRVKEMYRRIVQGDVTTTLPPEKNSIRIFLSSTFTDYKQERNLLLDDVLPYVQSFGREYGIDVIFSEMRWGISDEASKGNRTIELCLKEIEKCRDVSIGPFFCVMLGNKYGYRPPPPQLSVASFDEVIKRAIEEGEDLVLNALKESYHLDNNLVPPMYVLFERKNKVGSITGLPPPDPAQPSNEEILSKFFGSPSVTEREVLNGFLDAQGDSDTLGQRVAVFHRHIVDLGNPPSPDWIDSGYEKLNDLKLRTRLFAESHGSVFHSYVAPSLNEMDSYLIEFANDFCLWVMNSIKHIVSKNMHPAAHKNLREDISTIQEISSHHHHAERTFVGREKLVVKFVSHCETGKGALVLRGESGRGKTSLLGQVAKKLAGNISLSNGSTILLLRFLGTTPASSTSEAVASSMLHQLMIAYPDIASDTLDEDDGTSAQASSKFLQLVRALTSRGKRIIMVIDSLDQLDAADPGRDIYERWLPPLFGAGVLKNVAMLLSALPGHLRTIEDMKDSRIEDLPSFTSEEGEEMINCLCQLADRELQKGQREMILNQFHNQPDPLFLQIAFIQSLRWKSWDTDMEVPGSVQGQIALLFQQLSSDFGKTLVQSVISHMTLTKGGMSLDELRQVVSLNERVLTEVFRWHKTPDNLVPPLLIVGIMNRLDPYLVRRKYDQIETRFWYHRAFWEKAEAAFLSDKTWVLEAQKQAIQFYLKQPTIISSNSYNQRKLRQIPYRLRDMQDWQELHSYLVQNPEALLVELDSEIGQVQYASYWRSLRENADMDEKQDVQVTLCAFAELDLITKEQVLLIGDFLKNYFNAYDSALKVYQLALKHELHEGNLLEDFYRIADSRVLDCMSRIGDVYTRLSLYEEAHKWLSKSYSEMKRYQNKISRLLLTMKRNVGESHISSIQILSLLSRLMKDWGRYKKSLEYDTMLYDLSLAKFGPNDERVADAARQLARTHYLSGRYRVAINFYSQNLTIRKLLYGEDHPQTAVALNCMGMVNKVLGKYNEGIKYCERAYEVKLILYGKNHSDTAVTIDNLGSLYHLDGQFEKAMELYYEAWEIKKRTLGEKHADTIMMYGQVGRLYHDMGNLEKARSFLEENLRVRKEILDPQHPQIAVAKTPLAALLVDLGEYKMAYELAKESVDLRSEILGPLHPYTAFSYDTLSLAELGRDNVQAALFAANKSISIRMEVLGPDHFRCAQAHMTLAKVKAALGRGREAIDEAKKAHAINVKALREGHPFVNVSNDFLNMIQERHASQNVP